MNCKPGDLAVIVRSQGNNAGRIVQCVRLHISQAHDVDGVPLLLTASGPRWVIDRPLPGNLQTVPDAILRPLRDSDGEDETLTWAGKPESVAA
mgnify:CR=1 FL=1